jgi:tRNA-specific 2-thiouridylase
MSGGVDSSVAAALIQREGHEVVGATMKLWGGDSDSGCCSAADVQDARRAADQLGIDHHVFNFTEAFDDRVVAPYVADHAEGRTPNPCAECNRYLKFGAFLERACRLGFDAIATGHYAQVRRDDDGVRLARAVDRAKDQSYVLSMLTARELERVALPVGGFEKSEIRRIAGELGLVTAAKPDSQDVCFITSHMGGSGGRSSFLSARIPLHPGALVDSVSGARIGTVDAVELVTVGQRRGLAVASGERRFALAVDVATRTVVVGDAAELLDDAVALTRRTWVGSPVGVGESCSAQVSAHGRSIPARFTTEGVAFDEPSRRVARGQLVALYRDDEVIGSGVAC